VKSLGSRGPGGRTLAGEVEIYLLSRNTATAAVSDATASICATAARPTFTRRRQFESLSPSRRGLTQWFEQLSGSVELIDVKVRANKRKGWVPVHRGSQPSLPDHPQVGGKPVYTRNCVT